MEPKSRGEAARHLAATDLRELRFGHTPTHTHRRHRRAGLGPAGSGSCQPAPPRQMAPSFLKNPNRSPRGRFSRPRVHDEVGQRGRVMLKRARVCATKLVGPSACTRPNPKRHFPWWLRSERNLGGVPADAQSHEFTAARPPRLVGTIRTQPIAEGVLRRTRPSTTGVLPPGADGRHNFMLGDLPFQPRRN